MSEYSSSWTTPRVSRRVPRGDADRGGAGPGQPFVRAGRVSVFRRGQRRPPRDRRRGVRGEGSRAEDLLVDDLEPSDELAPVDTARDDVAFWLYSSGSTGRPKGVVHLQATSLHLRDLRAARAGDRRERRDLLDNEAVPRLRARNNLSFPYWAGATTALLSGRPTPDADLRGGRAVPPDALLLGANSLQRDARGGSGDGRFRPSAVYLRGRATSRRRLASVARRARPRDSRRDRID